MRGLARARDLVCGVRGLVERVLTLLRLVSALKALLRLVSALKALLRLVSALEAAHVVRQRHQVVLGLASVIQRFSFVESERWRFSLRSERVR